MRQFCPFVLDADANASSSAYSCCCCSCSVTWYMLLRSSVLRCVFCCMVETQQYTDWMALRQKLHYALGLLPAKWERKKTAALIWLTTYCFKPVSLLHLWGVSVQLPRFDYSGKRSSNTFFRLSIHALVAKIQYDKLVWWCPDGEFLAIFSRPVYSSSRVQHIADLHSKFALRPHHAWNWKYGRHPISDGWEARKKKEERRRRNHGKKI